MYSGGTGGTGLRGGIGRLLSHLEKDLLEDYSEGIPREKKSYSGLGESRLKACSKILSAGKRSLGYRTEDSLRVGSIFHM